MTETAQLEAESKRTQQVFTNMTLLSNRLFVKSLSFDVTNFYCDFT